MSIDMTYCTASLCFFIFHLPRHFFCCKHPSFHKIFYCTIDIYFFLFFHVINLNNPNECLLLEVSNKVPSLRRLFGFCTILLFVFLYRSNTVSSSRRRFTYINVFLQAINVSQSSQVCTSFVLCTNIVVLLYRRNDMTFAVLKFRLRHYRLVSLFSTFPLS